MGVQLGPLMLWEERRMRVFENRVLSRISGPKRDKVTDDWKKSYIMRTLNSCTPQQTLFG